MQNRESQVTSDLWILCFFVFILFLSGKPAKVFRFICCRILR